MFDKLCFVNYSKIYILIFLLFYTSLAISQTKSLNKDIKIDTIYVSLQLKDSINAYLNQELKGIFDSVTVNFNKQKTPFKLKYQNNAIANAIKFEVGKINFVTAKRNILTTTLDAALLGANVIILPYFPPVIPFYLMPATDSKVETICTKGLFEKNPIFYINPNGYFASKSKQVMRFKRKFKSSFFNFYYNLSKQYQKNNL